jgi:DNA-binding NtrC family response regulator
VSTLITTTKRRIERLYAEKRYRTALEIIEALDLRELAGGDPEELAFLYLMQARCYLRIGLYRKALLKLRVSIKLAETSSDYSLVARQKYALGQIYHETGRLERALEEYTESYVYFRRVRDTERMLAPLETTAMIHFMRSDYYQARAVCHKILQLAEQASLSEDMVIGYLNLALTEMFLGEFAEARANLNCALQVVPDKALAHRAQTEEGILNTYTLDYGGAAKQLDVVRAFYRGERATRDEIVCLEYLGLNEYFAGNYDKAKEYYDDILGREEITASARAQTLRMLTDVFVAKGQWPQAAETAELADAAITKINERIELGALDRARALISANAGAPEAAKDCFVKSIKGRSEVYDLDERRYYLRRARDLFAEMEVPKRVAEVEQYLRRAGVADSCRQVSERPALHKTVGPNPRGSDSSSPPVVIATSKAMRGIIAEVDAMAPTDLGILLTGETGTGKDLLAEYIHYQSGRSGEFITVNSAAIPNEMVESELFGHAKGAFTGAGKEKRGLFEMADQGTFYLNEISNCTPELQAKLLEVLEAGEIRRLGETHKRQVNFRLIAASNHDFAELIRTKKFRSDLFYRLRECQLLLPPLRQRPDDIPALVEHFLLGLGWEQDGPELQELCCQIGEVLMRRPWPGNVRALRAEVRRLWFAAAGDLTTMLELAAARDPQSEREELLFALRESDGNQSETARRLGISEGTVRNRIKKFDL